MNFSLGLINSGFMMNPRLEDDLIYLPREGKRQTKYTITFGHYCICASEMKIRCVHESVPIQIYTVDCVKS